MTQDDLLSRLTNARDMNVPERERENLCACAYTAITRLQAALAEARRVLRRLEWGDTDGDTSTCPACGERQRMGYHAHDCALAAVLAQEEKS
jgi:hypothetical protein